MTDEGPTPYAVRLTEQAIRDRADAVAYLAVTVGEEYAREWYIGLSATFATLATQPYRNAIQANESRLLGRPVRREFYRKTIGSFAYLLFYDVVNVGEEGPTVLIVHLRHGARRPLTAREARSMRSSS